MINQPSQVESATKPSGIQQLSQVDYPLGSVAGRQGGATEACTPGEGKKKQALDLQGLALGGDSWTRTNDPIDVNDVLCHSARFLKLQTDGILRLKPLKIRLPGTWPFSGQGCTCAFVHGALFLCVHRLPTGVHCAQGRNMALRLSILFQPPAQEFNIRRRFRLNMDDMRRIIRIGFRCIRRFS